MTPPETSSTPTLHKAKTEVQWGMDSLIPGALAKANSQGLVGILMGMFDLTATGITSAIIFSFIFALIFKPRD